MERDVAARYVQENFEPTDRLAVVLLNKRNGAFVQRLADAQKIATNDFQSWLRDYDDQGYEIYISMNALHAQASGRCKKDVATIRHLYLDFDEQGTAAVGSILSRGDVPTPNYIMNSSPDKWQVVWKVRRFEKDEAERLQRGLARDTGADPAATDCARVLRLPGFHNHKYAVPHLVSVESRTSRIYQPEHFPLPKEPEQNTRYRSGTRRSVAPHPLSQSERDWAYAKRALARGASQQTVIAAIEEFRRYNKHNPRYYAETTVRKAAAGLAAERLQVSPTRA